MINEVRMGTDHFAANATYDIPEGLAQSVVDAGHGVFADKE